MANIGPYIVGAAFWIFLGVCAVAGIVADYKRRRFSIDLLRAAIDKGQQLDPAVIEKLISPEVRGEQIEPVQVKLGGIITIAAGIGICPLSYFVSTVVPLAFYPILGAGVLAICVGVGLLIGAKVLADSQQRERSGATLP